MQAITSAKRQSITSTIWIRIDGPDACDQQCFTWLQQTAEADPSITLLTGRERLGTFGSYREIFSGCNSEFLCQLDADDWLENDAVSTCIEALNSKPNSPFAYSNCKESTSDGCILRPGSRSLTPFDQRKMLVQFITFHLRIIRRNAYNEAGGYNPKLLYTGDYDLSLRLCELGDPIHINKALYNYRLHDSNTSLKKRQHTILEAFSVAKDALKRRREQHLFSLELEPNSSRVHLKHRLGPIVITGMHRSGTSLLALMLQHLGMDLGSQLLPADHFNPDGYLEDQAIVELQRSWLQHSHQGMDGWADWGWAPDPAEADTPTPTAQWLSDARDYLNQRRQAKRRWGWKDPRSTLFLEHWLSLDPGLRVVGIYRHPWEIIDALQRISPPIFLAHPNWCLAIWCHYNRALLSFAQRYPERCILISSESLRAQPARLPEILETRWQWSTASTVQCDGATLEGLVRVDRLKSHELNDPLIALHAHCNPEAWQLFEQLNQCADLPSPLASGGSTDRNHALHLQHTESNAKQTAELSVIITSYNQGDLLLDAVASVEHSNTNHAYIELLIVDDGSTDARTNGILDELNQLGYRILRQTNQGLSSARNTGIQATKAPVLLFLDDDNRLLPPYLTQGLEMLRRHASIDVVYGDRIDFGLTTQKRRVGLVSQEELWQMNRIDNCTLIRRSLLERCGGYDTGLPAFEDWDLWLNAMNQRQGLQLAYLSAPCFEYRVRPLSMLQRLFRDRHLQAQVMHRLRVRHGQRVGHGGLQAPELAARHNCETRCNRTGLT